MFLYINQSPTLTSDSSRALFDTQSTLSHVGPQMVYQCSPSSRDGAVRLLSAGVTSDGLISSFSTKTFMKLPYTPSF